MIPYDLDPSLHTTEPEPATLDDGFSPPHHESDGKEKPQEAKSVVVDPALWAKSEF